MTPDAKVPNPGLLHLLVPKYQTARARALAGERGRAARWVLLGVFGVLFWAFIFGVVYRLLKYFRGVQEIGPLLAGKLLGLILVGFFSILLLSNVITALSSFFLARDLDLLVAAPVDWLKLYGAKLFETLVHSSWMVVLMAIPLFAAYGVVYGGGPFFPLIVIGLLVPFLTVPAAIGSAVTLLLVNIFPARRTRDILSVIAILTAGGIVLLFRLVRPERFARPEGFRSLVDFITLLRTPTSPLLPSEWVQRATMAWLTYKTDLLPWYLLWSTAAAAVVLGALLHWRLYPQGFSKAQESAERWARGNRMRRIAERMLAPLGVLRRELVLKELRLFFRDTTQWSQLILLTVLVRRGWLDEARAAMRILLVAYYMHYAIYLVVPAVGPIRAAEVAPEVRAQLVSAGGAVTRRVRLGINAVERTRQDAFPSAHASVAIIIAVLAQRHRVRGRTLFAIAAAAIMCSTVVLGYHYIVDVIAAVPLAVCSCSLRLKTDRGRRSESRRRSLTRSWRPI